MENPTPNAPAPNAPAPHAPEPTLEQRLKHHATLGLIGTGAVAAIGGLFGYGAFLPYALETAGLLTGASMMTGKTATERVGGLGLAAIAGSYALPAATSWANYAIGYNTLAPAVLGGLGKAATFLTGTMNYGLSQLTAGYFGSTSMYGALTAIGGSILPVAATVGVGLGLGYLAFKATKYLFNMGAPAHAH